MSERINQTLGELFEQRKTDGAVELRRSAWEAFTRAGLPNRRVESWHYTDLRGVLDSLPPPERDAFAMKVYVVQKPEIAIFPVSDGRFWPATENPYAPKEWTAQSPPGVEAQSLRDALAQGDGEVMEALAVQSEDAALALNAALMEDGVVLRIAPGATIAPVISLPTFLTGGQARFTRSLVLVGAGAHTTIVEEAHPLSFDGAQENHATILRLGEGADVRHVASFHASNDKSARVYSLIACLRERASLTSTALVEGGGMLRRQIFAKLEGRDARATFNGAALLGGRAHADTTLRIEHAAEGGVSRERFRTVVDDSATGVFQGKVAVRREAQKTDGLMQSKALLLSDGATMNNKPELEIFADDVVCGHGATCGRLDADQLFYLQARGLPRGEAEALLIEGFVVEALEAIEDDAMRGALADKIRAWLAQRETAQ